MIEIQKIDFKNKTIDNVKCSYGNVKDIQMSLIKNTFCVKVIYNEGETITTEYKKPKKEDTIEDVKLNLFDMETENTQQEQTNISCKVEEQQEEVKEQQEELKEEETEELKEEETEEPKEEVKDESKEEEHKDKSLSIEELKELLTEKIEKKNTALSYGRTIKQVYDYFKSDDVYSLLQKEQEIIAFIEDKYKTNISSISSKLCGVLKCYTVLNLESKGIKDRIQHFKVLLKVKHDADKEKLTDKKSIEEGEEILNHCHVEMNKLGDTLKNDINLLNSWDITAQMYCVLKIYLEIGNFRGGEIIDMKILDTDTEDKINYINVKTNKIIIRNHKTEKSQKERIIDIEDKKLINILKKGLGKYLITDKNNEPFKTSSKFGEYFKSLVKYTPYDLREALTSKTVMNCLTSGDTETLERLASIQGHSLTVMLNHYNKYNQENIILDTCLIEDD
jgi:integrase